MVKVRGGLRGAVALLREHPVLLALHVAVLPCLGATVVAAVLGVDVGRLPDVLWFLGLGVVTVAALRDRVTVENPFLGPARRNLAALRRRDGGHGAVLGTVTLDGRVIHRWVVADPASVRRPGLRDRDLAIPVTKQWGNGREAPRKRTVEVVVGAAGLFVARFEVDGVTRDVTLDVRSEARVEVASEARRRADATGRGPVPRGVTARAARTLAGQDLRTSEGLDRARREMARALHPDAGGDRADEDLLGEVNAALDAYEARLGA